jgi:hypothetical protein
MGMEQWQKMGKLKKLGEKSPLLPLHYHESHMVSARI